MQYQQMLQVKQLQNQNALFPGQQQLQQQQISNNAIALNRANEQAVYAGYGSLLNDPNITLDKITTALASRQALGYDTSKAINPSYSRHGRDSSGGCRISG